MLKVAILAGAQRTCTLALSQLDIAAGHHARRLAPVIGEVPVIKALGQPILGVLGLKTLRVQRALQLCDLALSRIARLLRSQRDRICLLRTLSRHLQPHHRLKDVCAARRGCAV